jgi:hypothetical protein
MARSNRSPFTPAGDCWPRGRHQPQGPPPRCDNIRAPVDLADLDRHGQGPRLRRHRSLAGNRRGRLGRRTLGSRPRPGLEAFREGRFADAVISLQPASDRFQSLRRSNPNDALLTRLHGVSLVYLAGSLRDLKRPGEALARARESLAVYESMATPNPGDLYNMGCDCAMVSAPDDRG